MTCCQPESTHPGSGCCQDIVACCSHHGIVRRFVSKDEKLEHLEHYKAQLEKEIAGVTEHIDDLKRGD